MPRRLAAVVLGGLLLALGLAAPASAHVSVEPQQAEPGGYAKLSFRVPNEREGVSTNKVEINLPADKPFAYVGVKPLAGWKVDVTKEKLPKPVKTDDGEVTEGVTKVTWTAADAAAAIAPGQFEEFVVMVGPLPDDADQIVFKALQTYSDNEVVRWIEEPAADEPEHPAPVLKLAKAASTDDDKLADDGDGLAIAGLVAGIAGLLLGAFALARTRAR